MNIPFPILYPRLVDPAWFNADSPCDEDAELTSMEQAHQQWLNSIGQQNMKRPPLGKPDPEPMEEEADSDEEEGNDESDESGESHDEDEEEELRTYAPPRTNNEVDREIEVHDHDGTDPSVPDQSAVWPEGRTQPLN